MPTEQSQPPRRRRMPALRPFGALPEGERADRLAQSPQYRDGVFHNPQGEELRPPKGGDLFREFRQGQPRRPSGPIPVVAPEVSVPVDGVHITWLGHATTLVHIEGRTILFDPVWSARCSPSQLVGPRRLHRVPLSLARLPRLDAIVISHDHYDHLDYHTVRTLCRLQSAPFLMPLGVGAHLERWRVPRERIIELDWADSVPVGDLTLTATAAQHFSGRGLTRNRTLWSSWVVAGTHRRLFYTGDSGYFAGYAGIGSRYGPFDATLVQIGAYSPSWPDIHMTPEEAADAHRALQGDLLIPVHWATFVLAFHAWGEPVDRLWHETKARDIRLAVPRPGQRVDVDAAPEVDGWWQGLAAARPRTGSARRLEKETT